ncbi:3-dehydroquinate dehydratase [Candidatus Moduliflexus flocculans]|uniref:3-dehydroquinate dehydratase n=1 Tax=Candidatus Moduliflexus flocculans TaxID=1499966 RepID=A0A081BPJ8_9BACT|nr:3-dehydroquinate dehydratase [Candidatus Moduliflexus flocculans]
MPECAAIASHAICDAQNGHRVMICIALGNLTYDECLHAVNTLDFAEIRLDMLALTHEQVATVFAANSNLIATCRPGKYDDDERQRLLLNAIASGAAYVDIEMDAADAFKQAVIQAARARGTKIIISYHDFEKTPLREELEYVVRWCSEFNPDIIKIACMAHSPRDNARLLGLLDSDTPMLVVGMGERGKISRVVSPLLGSFCTFASYTSDKATAPGQLFKDDIQALIERMQQL